MENKLQNYYNNLIKINNEFYDKIIFSLNDYYYNITYFYYLYFLKLIK